MKLKPDPMDALDRLNSLKAMLETLAVINQSFLEDHQRRTGKPYTSLHEAAQSIEVLRGAGEEVFHDVHNIVSEGKASLTDVACWRIAELRASGKDAAPMLVVSNHCYSVKIRIDDEDGVVRIEDPADIVR